jgi:NADH-quinone oxidoreductase subunit J
MLFVIVYVGAVAVLFLFVIMMLNVKLSNLNASMYRYLPISTIFGFVFLCEILVVLYVDISSVNIHNLMLLTPPYSIHLNFLNIWANSITPLNNIVIFGQLLYTYYSYLFITSGLILLVSMIGAISLTLHRRNDIKRQYIYKQVQRDFYTAISWKN